MIVELPGTASDYQIGRIKHYKMGFFHFSNNNLSIRKTCAEELGRYDPKAKKSEDVDICFRIARDKKWVALREKGNSLRHKARKTFGAFVKQIWGWGYHVGYPYSKTGIKGIYLYWIDSKDHKIKYDIEIENFPFLVCMFLTDFHIAHMLLSIAILAGFAGKILATGVAIGGSLFFFWRYLHDDRSAGLSFRQTCRLSLVHYAANVVFSAAAILGALKHGLILVPSAIFRPRSSSEN